jgi:FkbM family methyltransferase
MGFNIFSRSLYPRPLGGGEWEFVSRFLKSGMTVFDIGANQGLCTILAAARVGSEGKVIAFEPAPTECRKLRANLRLNRCQNVIVEPMALGSREGVTDFHLCLDHQGSFSSIRRQAPDVTARTELIKVPITTLDCYIQRAPTPSLHLMKIDAEGAELDILKGAAWTLANLRPVMINELAEVRTRQWGYPASEIYSWLAARGYRWFEPTSEGGLRAAPKKECYEPEENLVAVPDELVKQIVPRSCNQGTAPMDRA